MEEGCQKDVSPEDRRQKGRGQEKNGRQEGGAEKGCSKKSCPEKGRPEKSRTEDRGAHAKACRVSGAKTARGSAGPTAATGTAFAVAFVVAGTSGLARRRRCASAARRPRERNPWLSASAAADARKHARPATHADALSAVLGAGRRLERLPPKTKRASSDAGPSLCASSVCAASALRTSARSRFPAREPNQFR
jgi:hypothetical protein